MNPSAPQGPLDTPGFDVQRELLVHGAKFDYERLTFTSNTGATMTREAVRHPGSVIILPLQTTRAGTNVILIRNWRLATESWLWELPAGTLEKGEDPAACAARELEEETGFRAATLGLLCRFHTSPGLSDEYMSAYVATGLGHVGQHLEADERVTVHPMPVSECMDMLSRGSITDAKTMLTLLWAWRHGVLRT